MRKKLDAHGYDTDKSQQYLNNYEQFFQPLIGKEIRLLELGVATGGSLLLWRDYFENGVIVGLDVKPIHIEDPTGRIRVYQGLQQDIVLLDRIGQEMAPDGFDVIIDDASHIGEFTRISFWHLFDNHLKPGGIYVIEDWGTGYWDTWKDGRRYKMRSRQRLESLTDALLGHMKRRTIVTQLKSLLRKVIIKTKTILPKQKFPNHSFGMVGFIKECVDECGMGDITHPTYGISFHHPSKFQKMQISHGQVFIVKASSP